MILNMKLTSKTTTKHINRIYCSPRSKNHAHGIPWYNEQVRKSIFVSNWLQWILEGWKIRDRGRPAPNSRTSIKVRRNWRIKAFLALQFTRLVAVNVIFQWRFSSWYDIFQLFPSLSFLIPSSFHDIRSTGQGRGSIPSLCSKRMLKSLFFRFGYSSREFRG